MPVSLPVSLPSRPGDLDEVRVGFFGAPDGTPVPPNPLTEAVARLFGSPSMNKLRLRAVTIRAARYCGGAGCPTATDLDTHLFTSAPQKIPAWFLSVALSSSNALDALRYAAAHQLVLPLDRLLPGGTLPVADAWSGAMDVTRAHGQTWVLPLAVQPLVLTYQPAAFRASSPNAAWHHPSLALPPETWTWADLLATAKQLTAPPPPQTSRWVPDRTARGASTASSPRRQTACRSSSGRLAAKWSRGRQRRRVVPWRRRPRWLASASSST